MPLPLDDPLPRYQAIHTAIAAGLITAAHDSSDGGIAVALAEMALAARLGLCVVVPADGLDPFTSLVNEGPGRLVLTGSPGNRGAIAAALGDFGRRIGEVTGGDRIVMAAPSGASGDAESLDSRELVLVELTIDQAVEAFTGGAVE